MSPTQASSDSFPRLNGTNFLIWKARVTTSLKGKGLNGFIEKRKYEGDTESDSNDSDDLDQDASTDVDMEDLVPPLLKQARAHLEATTAITKALLKTPCRRRSSRSLRETANTSKFRKMEARTRAFLFKTIANMQVLIADDPPTAYDYEEDSDVTWFFLDLEEAMRNTSDSTSSIMNDEQKSIYMYHSMPAEWKMSLNIWKGNRKFIPYEELKQHIEQKVRYDAAKSKYTHKFGTPGSRETREEKALATIGQPNANPSNSLGTSCLYWEYKYHDDNRQATTKIIGKGDKQELSPEAPMMNMEQPKEGAARKEAPDGVSTKTAITLRSGRAQGDAEMAVRASQHGKGGAPDPSGTIEEGTTPTRAEGSRKEASTETAPVERYEALSAKLRVSPNAVNRVEIEYEVRLMFTALYNGMRILEKPKKANDNYPTLNGEEADALVDLFRLLAIEKGKSFPEWKRTIQDLCKDMHRSSWTVVALIQKRIDQNRLAAETKASPWGSQTSTRTQTNVKEQGTQPFIFKSNKYSEEEQRNMIRHCKQKFEYSLTLRQPTTMEWDIMLAIVEGELLIRHLPQFLRRVCDGDTLFRFQNTIAAQVEGELVGKLSDATQVYKDHQSTGRIVEAILQAARFRNDGKMEETMAMLRDLKAAEYNDSTHSLHFYFFDRSTAAKWDRMTIPFRRQLVHLISAHPTETTGERPEADSVWNRQLGADGLQNAESRSRYKIQLLNTARSMNMSLFLEYLKQTTGKRFYAYPLDKYGPISHQSQWWEVLFEEESCPKALIDVRRIIWRGRTIILHHASKYRMAPCLICGAAGHFARACKATEHELTTNNCIHADDEIVSKLPRKPATFTSAAEIKESVSDGIDKKKQPLQPATENPHASGENKPSENTNPATPDETNTSSLQPNSNPNNLTKNVSFTVKTGISGQQTGNLKEQAKAKPNDGAVNTKGPASKASQKNGPRQISKDGIRWAKELMRFRRDMDELMKDGEYTIQDVMDANGLAEATTPPTGNCQFYAVTEAMLQIVHDNMTNEKLLEATASRIKQSMNAAARLNFDLEFPEGTHLGILEALGRGDRKMSPKEKRADVLDYFSDIARSSSSRSSTLPGSLRGGPESLRMAAKALQRKIFVLIETTYGDRKGFAIYKPQSRVHGGGQFLSAKEYVCTGKQWEDELRQDRNEAEATSCPLPIVMKFANEHYNSLHFRTLNDPTPLANMMSSSLAKHLQGSVRSKAEFKTDRSGQFEDDRETDDSMEDSDNSSLGESVWTPSLDEREKFEPNQLSGQHGWSFASQENQLVVYHSPTIELPQQPRKRERDETLMLTAIDGDVAINLNSPNIPLKKTKTLSRRLAIEGDSMQKRRDLERTLQEHWEGFQEQWKQETKCSFPLLSSNRDVWTQAALNEWERILAMLKTSPGPHHVLNHLSGPTLVDLTQVLREQVIEEGLKRLSYRTDQAETRVWITGWFDRIATATTKQQRAALLNSKEDWLTLGKMKYGGFEVLRLCHPTQLEKLSRYIICTVVYEEELQTFRSSDAEDPDILYEAIEDLCAMLKQTRELKAAFKSGEELSEWSALSVIMAQVTMEVDSVEPSRITTAKEESRLRYYWNRIWGVANLDEPTSFWSIHPDATGGVAILTNPKTISETQLIEESKWTNRTVAIKSKGVVWINVYAPNKKAEREHFFRRLNEEFGTRRAAAVLGGDFNCVLDKQRDRYQRGVRLPVQCESAELRRLVTEWNIYDARELVEDPEWPVQREPTEHFTYWRKNSASRLDRFYIAGNLGSAVQWEAIELPKRYSDHQAVVLHMKWTSQPQRPKRVNKCRYPMRTSRPDLVRTGVQKAIAHELELMQSEGSIVGATWSSVSSKQY
ncbi:hypothetical protein FI667_g15611, partial [Globisporangium splendens]